MGPVPRPASRSLRPVADARRLHRLPTLTCRMPSLRPATPDDAAAIAAIWHSGWRDGHVGHVPDALLPHRGLDEFERRTLPRLSTTTVAELDGVIVGFVTVEDDEAEQVYVAASARGTGVAAALLNHAEHVIAQSHAVA